MTIRNLHIKQLFIVDLGDLNGETVVPVRATVLLDLKDFFI